MNRPDRERFSIVPAQGGRELEYARSLFREYAESLEFVLDFQDFDRELANLPGAYAEPRGKLLLAFMSSRPAGCIALRPLTPGICEMKRLFVRPAFRRFGLGRILAEALIDSVRNIGYARMRLDTTPSMAAARRLYQNLGFADIPPYCFNPIEGAFYMELVLASPQKF